MKQLNQDFGSIWEAGESPALPRICKRDESAAHHWLCREGADENDRESEDRPEVRYKPLRGISGP